MSRSETDSVSPDGGNVSGEVTDRRFAYTLTITDIATEWTVERVQGSSLGQASVYASFPVSLKGDTGGEFSNTALKAGCEQREFPCTRTRSYHKNDNCYEEQKNGDGVRKAVGSARYQAGGFGGGVAHPQAPTELLLSLYQVNDLRSGGSG